MKKSLIKLILATIFIAITACDRIPKEERLIEVQTTSTEGKRTVLLEDFTGELCVNCPKAAKEIHTLQELYKEKLVAVGLHGSDAFTPKNSPLRSEEAVAYYTRFANGAGLPAGMVNRKKFPGNASVITDGYATWAGLVRQELALPQIYQIEGTAKMSDDDEHLQATIKVSAVSNDNLPAKAMLQVWLIEDGIIYNQTGVANSSSYEHNHVLRGALNGTWGEELTTEKTYTYNYKLPSFEDNGKYSVVAFVYDAQSMEVLEAFQTKVQ